MPMVRGMKFHWMAARTTSIRAGMLYQLKTIPRHGLNGGGNKVVLSDNDNISINGSGYSLNFQRSRE